MSGSCPPLLVKTLPHHGLGLVKVHRTCTNRGNIHYLRRSIDGGSNALLTEAVSVLKRVSQSLPSNSRCMVTCTMISDVNHIVAKLSQESTICALKYYSTMTEEEKASTYEQWIQYQGKVVVMVSTLAFGIGKLNML